MLIWFQISSIGYILLLDNVSRYSTSMAISNVKKVLPRQSLPPSLMGILNYTHDFVSNLRGSGLINPVMKAGCWECPYPKDIFDRHSGLFFVTNLLSTSQSSTASSAIRGCHPMYSHFNNAMGLEWSLNMELTHFMPPYTYKMCVFIIHSPPKHLDIMSCTTPGTWWLAFWFHTLRAKNKTYSARLSFQVQLGWVNIAKSPKIRFKTVTQIDQSNTPLYVWFFHWICSIHQK